MSVSETRDGAPGAAAPAPDPAAATAAADVHPPVAPTADAPADAAIPAGQSAPGDCSLDVFLSSGEPCLPDSDFLRTAAMNESFKNFIADRKARTPGGPPSRSNHITSPFGMRHEVLVKGYRRKSVGGPNVDEPWKKPRAGKKHFHPGIDIASGPVNAEMHGTVTYVGRRPGQLGDTVIVADAATGEEKVFSDLVFVSVAKGQEVDLATKIGTNGAAIRATARGTVAFAGFHHDYGYMVLIDHGYGNFTRYAHMRKGSLRIKTGDAVERGSLLGEMGSTGKSTGRHLHYEKLLQKPRKDGSYDLIPVDPKPSLTSKGE